MLNSKMWIVDSQMYSIFILPKIKLNLNWFLCEIVFSLRASFTNIATAA